jgi:energy-coupling factor transporter ATP-binding protein EcfA2
VAKDDLKKWNNSLDKISEYLNSRVEIKDYNEKTQIITLQNTITEALPSVIDIEDDKYNKPKLVYTKEENGNKYHYYEFLPSIKFSLWERRIKEHSLKQLFKTEAVFKIYEIDSSSDKFDQKLTELGVGQAVLLEELQPIQKVIVKEKPDYLKDKKIFWGYGAGNSKYYKDINDMTHLMVIGGTGSGKSTLMNGLILSLIHNIKDISKLYLVDLKSGVEFNKYAKLDSDKVTVFSKGTKPSKLLAALQEVEAEMYLRLEYLSAHDDMEKLSEDPIFIIIDEYAQIELMPIDSSEEKQAQREIEKTLLRIGSLSRASNIKLFVQTQDPNVVSTELKKHLISRVLLKTGSSGDARLTLQDPSQMEILDLNHVKFGKGRFVYEDDNLGDTILTELQHPFLAKEDDNGELKADLNYFMKYKEDASIQVSHLNKKLEGYKQVIYDEYPTLRNTKVLENCLAQSIIESKIDEENEDISSSSDISIDKYIEENKSTRI